MSGLKRIAVLLILPISALLCGAAIADEPAQCPDWMKYKLGKLHSSDTLDLCALSAGKPVLIVNTASHCGYTRQFTGLEALHQRYRDRGLVVIGFPSNSFNQEARSAEKTAEVCYKNYGVTFAMTEAVPVRGAQAHPVFRHLSNASEEPGWNFNKFLVSADGLQVQHFGSGVEPESSALRAAIEQAL